MQTLIVGGAHFMAPKLNSQCHMVGDTLRSLPERARAPATIRRDITDAGMHESPRHETKSLIRPMLCPNGNSVKSLFSFGVLGMRIAVMRLTGSHS